MEDMPEGTHGVLSSVEVEVVNEMTKKFVGLFKEANMPPQDALSVLCYAAAQVIVGTMGHLTLEKNADIMHEMVLKLGKILIEADKPAQKLN